MSKAQFRKLEEKNPKKQKSWNGELSFIAVDQIDIVRLYVDSSSIN